MAEIIAHQRRQNDEQPGRLDRPPPKMAHVGVERLRAGHRQKDAAEDNEADRPSGVDKRYPRDWAQSLQNAPCRSDMHQSKHGVDGEEHHHDRAEEGCNSGRASALGREQQNEDDDRRRQDVSSKAGVDLFQSFERGEHGNRRRDHRVAREEGRAGDAEQKRNRRLLPEGALRQRFEGQDAAFALVVGLHQEQDIFRGDDNQQRPDNERDDADDFRGAEGAFELTQRRLQRVKGARADIAENDADRAKRENPEAPGRMRQVALAAINWRRDRVLRNGLGHSKS